MAQRLYEESNIQAIANALRGKLGERKDVPQRVRSTVHKSDTSTGHDDISHEVNRGVATAVKLTGAKHARVMITFYPYDDQNIIHIAPGQHTEYSTFPTDAASTVMINSDVYRKIYDFDINEYISFKHSIYYVSSAKQYGYYIDFVGFDENWNVVSVGDSYADNFPVPVLNTFKTSEMATAISTLGNESASETVLIEKSITENGTYQALNDGANGYSNVTVDVQPVRVTKDITENGTYLAASDNAYGFSSVSVNVQPALQDKAGVLVQTNGTHTFTPDEGYDGMNSITVAVDVAGGSGGGNVPLGSFGADHYPLVYATSAQAYLKNTGSMTRSAYGSVGGSNYKLWMVDETKAAVGLNVMDCLKSASQTSSNYRYYGIVYQTTKSGETPTLAQLQNYIVYKYGSVEHKSGALYAKGVLFNDQGTILYIGEWDDAIAALNAGEINISKGVCVIGTGYTTYYYSDSRDYGSISFNAE